MRRTAMALMVLLLAAGMGGSTAPPTSSTYYALDVRGGSRIVAADKPVRKGKVVLFHRYPDGAYVSLPADELLAVKTIDAPPAKRESDGPHELAPGATLYVGGALDGPRHPMPPAPDMTVAPADNAYGYDYGYSDYGYYGGGGYVRPHPPAPGVPSRIGGNGYPIIAPPGSAGSVPNPIGSNGFPILAPSPAAPVVPVPAPRRQ